MKISVSAGLALQVVATHFLRNVGVSVVMGQSCGYMKFGLEGYKCKNGNPVNNHARRVIFDAMEQAIEENTDFEIDLTAVTVGMDFDDGNGAVIGYPGDDELTATAEELASDTGEANGNGNGNGNSNGNSNGNGNGRRKLAITVPDTAATAPQQQSMDMDIESILAGERDHRQLQSCTFEDMYGPFCFLCGFGYDLCGPHERKLMTEEDHRRLNEGAALIKDKIQEIIDDGKGVGCLKGATVTNFNFVVPTSDDGTRKDDTAVEPAPLESSESASDGSDGSSSSGGSAATSIFTTTMTMVIPAVVVGAVGFFMA